MNGTIGLWAVPGHELSEPEVIKGEYFFFGNAIYMYSPTVIMHRELDATKYSYLSLSNALRLVEIILIMMLVLVTVCIIVNAVHRRKVKEGHPPYSDWYVIVPHIICIATFAGLTQMLSFFMFSIKGARAECAAITVLFIFLLSLRGAIRSREPLDFLVSALLLVLVHLTGVYYNRLPIDSFSRTSMITFFVIIGLLTALAIWTFGKSSDRGFFKRHSSVAVRR